VTDYERGYRAGVEAAKEKLRRTGFKNVDEFFADLSPAPTAPVPSGPREGACAVKCSCRHEPSFHGASGCMDDDCGCIASEDECQPPPPLAPKCGECGGTGMDGRFIPGHDILLKCPSCGGSGTYTVLGADGIERTYPRDGE
jgi:hypothetical protein